MLPAGTVGAALIPTAVLQPPHSHLGSLARPKLPWGEGEGPASAGLHLLEGTQVPPAVCWVVGNPGGEGCGYRKGGREACQVAWDGCGCT